MLRIRESGMLERAACAKQTRATAVSEVMLEDGVVPFENLKHILECGIEDQVS